MALSEPPNEQNCFILAGLAAALLLTHHATAQGVYLGQTRTLGLTVVNTLPDNFGTYAGNGLGDDWQVQYFGQKNLIFIPRLTDRTYTVTSRPGLLTGSYTPLTNPSAPSDSGQERTITDLSATGSTKFYTVEITKP